MNHDLNVPDNLQRFKPPGKLFSLWIIADPGLESSIS